MFFSPFVGKKNCFHDTRKALYVDNAFWGERNVLHECVWKISTSNISSLYYFHVKQGSYAANSVSFKTAASNFNLLSSSNINFHVWMFLIKNIFGSLQSIYIAGTSEGKSFFVDILFGEINILRLFTNHFVSKFPQ